MPGGALSSLRENRRYVRLILLERQYWYRKAGGGPASDAEGAMTRNVLAVGLLCAACCAAGYVRGFGIAETRGRVLLAEQAEASAQRT